MFWSSVYQFPVMDQIVLLVWYLNHSPLLVCALLSLVLSTEVPQMLYVCIQVSPTYVKSHIQCPTAVHVRIFT